MIITYFFGLFNNLTLNENLLQGLFWSFIIHATLVEFIYYWFHRILHFPEVYKRWHKYHHRSVNTEPTTALSFEIGERLSYTALFAIPAVGVDLLGFQSCFCFAIYYLMFDLMNEGGHINYEAQPSWYNNTPLKYIFYTPGYHALHHTRVNTNYSLFMPWTDILFGSAIFYTQQSTSFDDNTQDVV